MAQIPTPPASPPTEKLRKASPEDNSTPETPDALLERYLHLLDQHQKLQAELGKQLASGFFSLTQANYSCPPGRRYGEDYYDERMKATRTISIKDSHLSTDHQPTTKPSNDQTSTSTSAPEEDQDIDLSTLLSFQTLSLSDPPAKPQTSKQEQDTDSNSSDTDSDPDSNSEPTTSDQDSKPQAEAEADVEQTPKPPRNPLTWYGILVPPSLRSAQASFTSAIEGPTPSLAAIVIEMRDVERRVEAARRKRDREVRE